MIDIDIYIYTHKSINRYLYIYIRPSYSCDAVWKIEFAKSRWSFHLGSHLWVRIVPDIIPDLQIRTIREMDSASLARLPVFIQSAKVIWYFSPNTTLLRIIQSLPPVTWRVLDVQNHQISNLAGLPGPVTRSLCLGSYVFEANGHYRLDHSTFDGKSLWIPVAFPWDVGPVFQCTRRTWA